MWGLGSSLTPAPEDSHVAGITNVTELASKHAKGRAPSTTHDSASEWQRQESGEKGDVDQWEGDLLILAVGNAQQAGMMHCAQHFDWGACMLCCTVCLARSTVDLIE